MIGGKVLQDRHSPDGVRDATEQSLIDTEALIQRWYGQAAWATPSRRAFMPSCSDAQMHGAAGAGAPSPRHLDTVACGREPGRGALGARGSTRRRAPTRTCIAGFGCVRRRAVYAHCIYLDDADRQLMHETAPPPPSAQRATCSWAAASSTSSAPINWACCTAWPATWAGAPASARFTPCWRPYQRGPRRPDQTGLGARNLRSHGGSTRRGARAGAGGRDRDAAGRHRGRLRGAQPQATLLLARKTALAGRTWKSCCSP